MGYVIVKIKIMPLSLETNLKKLEAEAVKILEKNKADNYKFEIQPIAFGLKALILLFSWPEEKALDSFETELKGIKGVSSIEVIDMRRAIG